MTISSTVRIAGPFTGNGVTTTFPFTYKVFSTADVQVIRLTISTGVETTLTLVTDYNITLNGNQDSNPGGNIVLVAALSALYKLTATSDIANLQPTDLTNQGGFYPEVITDALDRATIQIQQISDISDRTLKIPISDGALNMELPTAASRANSFLAFGATGLPTVVTAGSSGAPTTMTRQNFSGTGSQVAFTLASDPGALGNSAEVFIGGVYQNRTTYTISGTTLTFSAAPVLGTDNIEFVNFLTDAIGSTSADLVTYTPAGTGAVARSAQSKMRDTVSVKDFGAVGDGVTNDAAAIQAAINAVGAVGGGIIFIPQGNYNLGTTGITIDRSGIILQGVGSHYIGTNYSSVLSYTGVGSALTVASQTGGGTTVSGVVLEDFSITGGGVYGITIGNSITTPKSAQVIIRNVEIRSCTTAGLRLITAQICSFHNLIIWNNNTGILIDLVSGGGNTTCSFYNCRLYSNTGIGLHVKDGHSLSFYSLVTESNGEEGVLIEKTAGREQRGIIFHNPHIEANNFNRVGTGWAQFKGFSNDAGIMDVELNNPFFFGNSIGDYHMNLEGGIFRIWYPKYGNTQPAPYNIIPVPDNGTSTQISIWDNDPAEATTNWTVASSTAISMAWLIMWDGKHIVYSVTGGVVSEKFYTGRLGSRFGSGALISKNLTGTSTWSPGAILNNAIATTTVTVTGAVVGDVAIVGYASITGAAGWLISSVVTGANVVTVTILNMTGATQTPSSNTVRVDIWQH